MSKAMRYRLTVWATVGIDEESGLPEYTGKELEKHLVHVLRKAEPDCDVECMDSEEIEEA